MRLGRSRLRSLHFNYKGVGASEGPAVDTAAHLATFWQTSHAPDDLARETFRAVRDYECIMVSEERVRGKLMPRNIMIMKCRTRPYGVSHAHAKPWAWHPRLHASSTKERCQRLVSFPQVGLRNRAESP
jgi:hypothetical protein